MDNQEQYSTISRDELIRLARESCSKNLISANGGGKTIAQSQYKVHNKDRRDSETESPIINLRVFMIRTVICIMLFLTVFVIDQFNISYQNINTGLIKECISTNKGLEDAENFFVSCYEQIVKQIE